MEELDIPIFKKAYELYKTFHELRNAVPKQDRHALWQRIENTSLAVIEHILLASQRGHGGKREPLEQSSVELNLLRVFLRLAKDTKTIDLKKYVSIQHMVDEIGRMLGGWLKSLATDNNKAPPQRNF
ncbi:MAG: diversity-generating retroelement protein Avd [Candidatus Peregrinibacteria bacterium]